MCQNKKKQRVLNKDKMLFITASKMIGGNWVSNYQLKSKVSRLESKLREIEKIISFEEKLILL